MTSGRHIFHLKIICILFASIWLFFSFPSHLYAKPNVIIETDMGGDKDDQASFVRWLLYTCDWNVKGIIFDRANEQFQHDNVASNPSGAETTMEMAYDYLDAYGNVYPNLVQHNPDYPTVEYLKSISAHGTNDSNSGRDLIIAAVDAATSESPIWYGNWGSNSGTESNLKRALDYVQATRQKSEYLQFISKIRIVTLDGPKNTRQQHDENIALHVETGFPQLGDNMESRWYRRFDNITATAGGFDVEQDVLNNHGPLAALYTGQKEGDSWTFIYLIPNGLSNPQHPEWGSWAGRYGVRDGGQVPHRKPFYWANQEDTWNGETHRDNTAKRFAAALQHDFKARLDWCVFSFAKANHPPDVVLQGDTTLDVLNIETNPGETVSLAATATDPDNDELHYSWWNYPEAGTYRSTLAIADSTKPQVSVTIPSDAAGREIHIVCQVTDTGKPALTRYRRAIISVTDASH